MNNKNFHPIQKVPPIAHALHHWDEATGTLRYEYNGMDVLTLQIPTGHDIGFRHGSDGSMQSIQYCQQIYVSSDVPVKAIVTFTLNAGAINLRPHRAQAEQAILGQLGTPLIHGANGMYDTQWDLLLDWHGCDWHWLSSSIETTAEGKCIARMEVSFSQKAMFINLRPQYYRKHLGYTYHKPWEFVPNQKAVAGWCSWEAYRRDISIDKIEHIAAFMNEKLKDYSLTYIQVDDGYQKMPLPANPKGTMTEGWFTCEETKFPGGHDSIVQAIKNKGFAPAVWTNANITNPEFPENHPNDVIFHDGKPLKGEWIDFLYTCSPECLATHVEPLFRKFKETGYTYVKIDAIRHLLFDGLHECVRLGIMTNKDAEARFRAYMEATRKGLGDEVYYLASWGEMHEVVGVADACRISMDANPTWAGVRMQLFESARWFHTHRILFLNDPDHVCVRTKLAWAKSVLSLISLTGELYMLSDTTDAYTPEKLEVIRKTLPPLTGKTAETGPLSLEYPAYTWTKLHGFAVQSHETPVEMEDVSLDDALNMAGDFPTMHNNHPFSSLWAFHLQGAQGSWCVAARIATMPLPACSLPLENLGLEANETYLAFDFWQQKFLGIVKTALDCEALAIGECQIIALHRMQEVPQLIASTRHVSMDAVSVKEYHAAADTLTVTLTGVPCTTEQYFVHLPIGMTLQSAAADGANITYAQGDLLVVSVEFQKGSAEIILHFKKEEIV